MKTIFNLNALVSVKIKDKERCKYLQYIPFTKSFWGNTKEGFYNKFSFAQTNPYTQKDIENGKFHDVKLIVEDNKVYYFPSVKLEFTNGSEYNKTFNTYGEALAWGEEQAKKGMDVQLVIE